MALRNEILEQAFVSVIGSRSKISIKDFLRTAYGKIELFKRSKMAALEASSMRFFRLLLRAIITFPSLFIDKFTALC